MPGRRRLCTYSARPVTLSHDSSRGTERPICDVSAAWLARFMDRPSQINANEVLLICRGAVQIAFNRHRLCGSSSLADHALVERLAGQHPLGGGKTRWLVGRRAHEDARLVALKDHRHAERRPVVGGTLTRVMSSPVASVVSR